MHELSLAVSIVELVRGFVPRGSLLRRVHLRAGPMRGIEPMAMEWAWRACVNGTDFAATELRLEVLPWSVRCRACDARFSSDDPFARCSCGSDQTVTESGDELQVDSIDVDDDIDEPLKQGVFASAQGAVT